MEQAVWVYFGVITVVLAFGIVGKLILDYRGEQKNTLLPHALEQLRAACTFVCDSAEDTQLTSTVELAARTVIRTTKDKICGDYQDTRTCVTCACNVGDAAGHDFILDLNTTAAISTYDTHAFACTFTRGEQNVAVACQG